MARPDPWTAPPVAGPAGRAGPPGLVRHRTLHGHVVEWLGARIVSGEFPVGSKLPIEQELAGRLGVGRSGVREAVKALAAKGLVAPRPRLGTVVQPRSSWNLLDPDVIEWRGNSHDDQFVRELLELRLFVEPHVARLAAERASQADIDRASTACAAMEELAQRLPASEADFVAADLDLHLALFRACGNELAGQLSRLLEAGLTHSIHLTAHLPGGVAATVPLHRQVVEAVAHGKAADAAEAMRQLLATTSAALDAEFA